MNLLFGCALVFSSYFFLVKLIWKRNYMTVLFSCWITHRLILILIEVLLQVFAINLNMWLITLFALTGSICGHIYWKNNDNDKRKRRKLKKSKEYKFEPAIQIT